MTRLLLAILLTASAVPAQAQAEAVPIQPSVDTAVQRQSLRTFISCVAEARPKWAHQLLAQPYLSEAQSQSAGEAFSGRDSCLRSDEVELTFRTSTIVSNLAEHFLRADLPRTDLVRLGQSLNTLAPLNTSEDFALCVAARAPAAARDLILSEPGGNEELQAAARLSAHIPPCFAPGEKLTVDLQALRGLMSIALYRATATVSLAKN